MSASESMRSGLNPMPTHWNVPPWSSVEFKAKQSRYAVVIPVINEGDRLHTQLRRMAPFLNTADILIVDGKSKDGSTEPKALENLGVSVLLNHAGGRSSFCEDLRIGFAFGLLRGYDGLILMDGNNKDNPEAILRFAQALEAGSDFVQGSRFAPGGVALNTPPSRTVSIRYFHAPLLSLAAGVRYTDSTNGFRAFSHRFLTDDRVQPFRSVFSDYDLPYYLAVRAGRIHAKVKEIPVERAYPETGPVPTKITPIRGNLRMLRTLFRVCLQTLNPTRQKTSSLVRASSL